MRVGFIVIVGKMFGNKTVHGVFGSREEATRWVKADPLIGDQHWEIVEFLPFKPPTHKNTLRSE